MDEQHVPEETIWVGRTVPPPQSVPPVPPKQEKLRRLRAAADEVSAGEGELATRIARRDGLVREFYPGISQAELAKAARVSRQRVSQIVAEG